MERGKLCSSFNKVWFWFHASFSIEGVKFCFNYLLRCFLQCVAGLPNTHVTIVYMKTYVFSWNTQVRKWTETMAELEPWNAELIIHMQTTGWLVCHLQHVLHSGLLGWRESWARKVRLCLLVDLCSCPQLWSWIVSSDWTNEITDTPAWTEFSPRGGPMLLYIKRALLRLIRHLGGCLLDTSLLRCFGKVQQGGEPEAEQKRLNLYGPGTS